METAVLLAIFGILSLIISVVIVGLFKLISDSNKNNDKLSTALDSLVKVHQDNAIVEAENSKKQTDAIVRTAIEAEKRNGHLAEITVQSRDAVIGVVQGMTINKQTVKNQTVEHEHVISKE